MNPLKNKPSNFIKAVAFVMLMIILASYGCNGTGSTTNKSDSVSTVKDTTKSMMDTTKSMMDTTKKSASDTPSHKRGDATPPPPPPKKS